MSTPTLPRPAEATAEPLTVTDQPQMSGRTDCYACPHPRTRHGSRIFEMGARCRAWGRS